MPYPHLSLENYARIHAEREAINQLPCQVCDVALWEHNTRAKDDHRFVSGLAQPAKEE